MALKLEIDMVPTSSWGKSLKKLLPQSKWDKLRKAAHVANGGRCEVCGSTQKLHGHEEWEFDEVTEIQRLIRIGTVCAACHGVMHFGRSKQLAAQGVVDIFKVVEHFQTVNGVDRAAFDKHEAEATEQWLRRSTIEWKIDFGQFAPLLTPGEA
jgi:hypothetical protein